MISIPDLTRVLADALGVDHALVAWAARALREAGELPTGERGRYGAAPMTAQHAATLLIGFLGAPRACDAPQAAQVFGKLPAISAVFQRAGAGRVVRTGHQIEDLFISRGEGPGRTRLTRSLHGALAGVIGAAALGRPSVCEITELGFVQDLAAPLAWIRFPIVAPGQDPCEGEIFYAPSDGDGLDPCERFRGTDLRITASTHGAVLSRLGQVLFEDAKTRVLADLEDAEAGAAPDRETANARSL